MLTHDNRVVIKAAGNATAVSDVLAPHVGCVVITNPCQVRLIAEAPIKTDMVDAAAPARLYAANFLPEVWMPNQESLTLRRQVMRPRPIVKQRPRLKIMIQSVLHGHLIPPCQHVDSLAPKGPAWLLARPLPPDESDVGNGICASMIRPGRN